MFTRRKLRISMLVATLVAGLSTVALPETQAATCTNQLAGSSFEIDPGANLKVDSADCIDWLAGGMGTALRAGVVAKSDQQSGNADNSFGKGAAENDPNPK